MALFTPMQYIIHLLLAFIYKRVKKYEIQHMNILTFSVTSCTFIYQKYHKNPLQNILLWHSFIIEWKVAYLFEREKQLKLGFCWSSWGSRMLQATNPSVKKIQPADFYPLFQKRRLWVMRASGYETGACLSALLMGAWWHSDCAVLYKDKKEISWDWKSQLDRRRTETLVFIFDVLSHYPEYFKTFLSNS